MRHLPVAPHPAAPDIPAVVARFLRVWPPTAASKRR
jgi:hypothetical protein